MKITIQPAYQDLEAIRELFGEYTNMVVENDPDFAHYLELQNYQGELAHLGEKYGAPQGRLYLVRAEGRPAGCVAMKGLDQHRCEMKRLYIRPAYRGLGLARRLVELLLEDAREEGYEAMVLDTFPFLREAIALYRSMGFYEIPAYCYSPIEGTVCMQKDVSPLRKSVGA